MKNTIKVICVIIGTIIGAGFASGREIYQFFNQYGINGILGLIISCILIGIIIVRVLTQVRDKQIESYNEYLEELKVSKKIKDIMNIIINFFLLISFYVMIAGFCSYFKQELNISPLIVGIVVCFVCHLTFMKHIEGVTKINTVLIPFLIFMIIFIGFKINIFDINKVISTINNFELQIVPKGNWLLAGLEYASYNSIILIPMLIGLKQYTKCSEKKIGIIVTILFFIVSLILYIVLLTAGAKVEEVELPLVHIVSKFGVAYKFIYGIVVASAIYTSAIAAGYGFMCNISKNSKSYKMLSICICGSAILVSKIGFSSLVNLLYPVLGLIGLIQIVYIIFRKT